MFDGLDVSTPVRVLGAIIILVALLGAFFWVVRRFGSERLGAATSRGRQPRLAVIDAATVDGRRRLVLIRRDNVEHLLMIGGPSDVVIEPNIVRAAAPPRDAAPPRHPTATDTLPRAVPLGEGTMWPLQPEPAPVARDAREPVLREPPPPREVPPQREPPQREPPQREPAPREQAMREPPRAQRAPAPPPQPMPEEAEWQEQAEPPLPPLPPQPPPQRARQPRAADPLAGLAEELSRAAPQEPVAETREPPRPQRREPPRTPRPQAAPPPQPAPAPAAEQQFNSAADQNLAEMAQRLEAALRRPAKAEDQRFAGAEPASAEAEDYPPPPPPSRAPAQAEARPARSEPRPPRSEGKPAAGGKSLYDSLEQEMASLLGRPDKKT